MKAHSRSFEDNDDSQRKILKITKNHIRGEFLTILEHYTTLTIILDFLKLINSFSLFQRSLDKQSRGSTGSPNALRVRRSDQALMTTWGNGRECPGHVAIWLLGLVSLTSTRPALGRFNPLENPPFPSIQLITPCT